MSNLCQCGAHRASAAFLCLLLSCRCGFVCVGDDYECFECFLAPWCACGHCAIDIYLIVVRVVVVNKFTGDVAIAIVDVLKLDSSLRATPRAITTQTPHTNGTNVTNMFNPRSQIYKSWSGLNSNQYIYIYLFTIVTITHLCLSWTWTCFRSWFFFLLRVSGWHYVVCNCSPLTKWPDATRCHVIS